MDPLNRFVTAMTDPAARPREAVVLRGYLGTSEDAQVRDLLKKLRALEDDGTAAGEARRVAKEVREALEPAFGTPDDPARIYLSADFDRYVDFDWMNDLIFVVPDDGQGQKTEDFTTTVWLRVRSDDPYVVVSRTALASDERFVRGRLLEDFMEGPEAKSVWDEQSYAPTRGKISKLYCVA